MHANILMSTKWLVCTGFCACSLRWRSLLRCLTTLVAAFMYIYACQM